MKKASKVFVLLLSVALCLCAFAACEKGTTTEQVTVTFQNGDTMVSTVNIDKGTALTQAQIPAAPVKEGYRFDGWYNGNTLLDASATYDADTTFTARWVQQVTVTFQNGDTVLGTVTFDKGGKIPSDKIPAVTAPEGSTFRGWFNGSVAVDETTDTFDQNTVLTAAWNKIAYVVTWKEGDSETTEVVSRESGKLTKLKTPVAVDGKVFLGWYNGFEKITLQTPITDDVTFTAEWASREDYNGVFFSEDWNSAEITFAEKVSSMIVNGRKIVHGELGQTVTFSASEGTVSAINTKTYFYTFTKVSAGMIVTYSEKDSYEDINLVWTKNFTSAVPNDAFVGEYRGVGGNYIEFGKYGNVLRVASLVNYGHYTLNGNTLTVYYKEDPDSAEETVIAFTVDEKGNLVGELKTQNAILVQATADEVTSYSYNTGNGSLYLQIYTHGAKKTCVYYDAVANKSSYFTCTDDMEINGIYTLTLDGMEQIIKIISSTSFVFAGAERGTYTCAGKEPIVLDGFDKAVVGTTEGTYEYFKASQMYMITVGASSYSIRLNGNTYTVPVPDAYAGYYKNTNKSYSIKLDGFGGVRAKNSGYYYDGSYTVTGNTLTVANTDSWVFDRSYQIVGGGKVLYNPSRQFFLEGYSELEGLDAIDGNWTGSDGSILSVNTTDFSVAYKSGTYDLDYDFAANQYFFAVSGVKYVLDSTDSSITVTPEGGSAETYGLDGREGAYNGNWSGTTRFILDGRGHAKQGTSDYTYTVAESDGTFQILGYNSFHAKWTATGFVFLNDKGETQYTYTKAVPDELKGTSWKDTNGNTLSFDGLGGGTYYNGSNYAFTYTLTGKQLVFSVPDTSFSYNLTVGETTMSGTWDYGEGDNPMTLTKQAEIGNAIKGTWKDGKRTYTFDGQGKGTMKFDASTAIYDFDYTISGTTVTFTIGEMVFSLVFTDNKLVGTFEQDSYPTDITLTKQA